MMKKRLILLVILLATSLLFKWGQAHYEEHYKVVHGEVAMLELEVLGADGWMLDEQQKAARIAQHRFGQRYQEVKSEEQSIKNKIVSGKWIAAVSKWATIVFSFYFVWYILYVELFRNRGYVKVAEWVKRVARKPEQQPDAED